ncbi:MAG: two pore domain potassium channel family protein [Parcubacteria group bacterium]|nr:two pore domain potassium channel family protein [Parcubacteria group bacterium]
MFDNVKKKKLKLIFYWVIGILFIVLGIESIFSASFILSSILILCGFVMIPLITSDNLDNFRKILVFPILSYISFFVLLRIFDNPIVAAISFITISSVGMIFYFIYSFMNTKRILGFIIPVGLIILVTLILYGQMYTLPSSGENIMYDRNTPKNLTNTEGFYFSVITLTTLGYGDIQPTGYFRYFATAEVLTGVLLLGIFINGIIKIGSK